MKFREAILTSLVMVGGIIPVTIKFRCWRKVYSLKIHALYSNIYQYKYLSIYSQNSSFSPLKLFFLITNYNIKIELINFFYFKKKKNFLSKRKKKKIERKKFFS